MTENSGSNSGGNGGAEGGAGGGEGAQAAITPGQVQTQSSEAKSLRSSLGELLGESERPSFDKWAGGYTTDKDFAVAAMNLRQTYDARVPVPGKDAKPEDFGKYFERVGKPKSAEEYKFEFGNVEISDHEKARFDEFRKYAFENHFTQPQFEKAVGFYLDTGVKQTEVKLGMAEQFQKTSVETLKKEWGPDYDENLLFARHAGNHFAGDAEWKEFADTRLENGMFAGDHPTIIKMMAKIGRGISEDTRARMVMKESEVSSIQARIDELERKSFAEGGSTYEGHYAQELDALYKKLYPGKRRV